MARGANYNVRTVATRQRAGQRSLVPVIAAGARLTGRAGRYAANLARDAVRIIGRPVVEYGVPAAIMEAARRGVGSLMGEKAKAKRPMGVGKMYGRVGKRLRRFRSKKLKKAFYRGVVIRSRAGGVVDNVLDSKQCVVVGHTTVFRESLLRSAFLALFRALFMKAGVSFGSIEDRIGSTGTSTPAYQVYMQYRVADGDALSPIFFNVNNDNSLKFVAESAEGYWLSAYQTAMQGATQRVQLTLFDVSLNTLTPTATQTTRQFRLVVDQLMLNVSCKSSMTVQNRTTAATGTADESNMLDVANNPLRGKVYETSSNGFKIRADFDGNGYNPLYGEPTIGLISKDNSLGTEITNQLRSPPYPQAFVGRVKAQSIVLAPGEIRKSYLKSSFRLPFNTMLKKMGPLFQTYGVAGEALQVYIGKSRMFILDKTMDTGINEPAINLGYDIEFQAEASCYERKPKIAIYNYN